MDARRRLRLGRRAAARGPRDAERREGDGRRLGWARPRLRDHARLPRARAGRRVAPGRRAGHALPDRARPRGDRADDRGRRGDQPARHGPGDGAAVRARGRRLVGQGRDRGVRAGRGRGPRARALACSGGGGRPGDRADRRDDRGAADGRGLQDAGPPTTPHALGRQRRLATSSVGARAPPWHPPCVLARHPPAGRPSTRGAIGGTTNARAVGGERGGGHGSAAREGRRCVVDCAWGRCGR